MDLNSPLLLLVVSTASAIVIPVLLYLWTQNKNNQNKRKAVDVSIGGAQNTNKRGEGQLKYTPLAQQDFSHSAMVSEVQSKWQKPLELVAVHTDLPRLAKKLSIYQNQVALLLPSEGPEFEALFGLAPSNTDSSTPSSSSIPSGELSTLLAERLDLVEQILKLITQGVGENPTIIDSFRTHIQKETYDLSVPLLEFLQRLGEDHKTTRVLKACNQSVLAPGVLRLKFGLANGLNQTEFQTQAQSQSKSNQSIRFKDKRGSWAISVRFTDQDIQVTQFKQEVSWKSQEEDPSEWFEFSWRQVLRLSIDTMTLLDVQLVVTEFKFHESMPESRRQQITSLFKEIYRPDLHQPQTSAINPSTSPSLSPST